MVGRALGAVAVIVFFLASTMVVPASAGQHRPLPGTDFTLVVLPDTQMSVQSWPELLYAQTQWILDHHRSWNIRFVVHVGDLVQTPARRQEWDRATTAFYPLNGTVPYAIAVGNHDFDAWSCRPPGSCDPWEHIAADRSATTFNRYFPRRSFERWPSFGGGFPSDGMDNSYFTFTGGGVDWLVMTLKYGPTAGELAWADRVISAHRGHQVLVGTHDYQGGTARTAAGERIWESLRQHPNVQFVFSGHHATAGTRIDRGAHGNLVYQLQADYQTASVLDFFENSYLRLLEFDAGAGSVSVWTFSPYCQATGRCPAFKTDPANEFTLTGVRLEGVVGNRPLLADVVAA